MAEPVTKPEEEPAYTKLLAQARELGKAGKNVEAAQLIEQAIPLIVSHEGAASQLLADTHKLYAFTCYSIWAESNCTDSARLENVISSYGLALTIREQSGESSMDLAHDFTNFGAVYYATGRYDDALVVNEKALKMGELFSQNDQEGCQRLAIWNHLAGTYHQLGRLDDAEQLLKRALSIVKENNPDRAYLLSSLAGVYESRAQQLREQAEKIAAPNCCAVRPRQ